jgi:hypothetical protein
MSEQCAFAWGATKCSCHGRVPGHRVLREGERHEADIVERLAEATTVDPSTVQVLLWAIQDQFELLPKEGS